VEYISGESYNSWIKKIRKILAFSNGPLQYKKGIWSFEIGEIDPQFELEPEKRYAAAVYNKIPKYSKTIRQGLAESLGLKKIKEMGGFTIVQDPKTAEADAMPNAAIKATTIDKVLPLEDIGLYLLQLVNRKCH
jgi:hypothetical protein